MHFASNTFSIHLPMSIQDGQHCSRFLRHSSMSLDYVGTNVSVSLDPGITYHNVQGCGKYLFPLVLDKTCNISQIAE